MTYYTEDDIREKLFALARECGTLLELSRRMGISLPYLSEFMNGRKSAGPSIAEFLGLEKVVRYVEIDSTSRHR